MPTIKQLCEALNGKHYLSRYEKRDNERKARFIVDYCKYLESLMSGFVKITIQVSGTDNSKRLIVDYKSGNSAVVLDEIFTAVLLPEVEKICKEHKKRIVTKFITSKKAA